MSDTSGDQKMDLRLNYGQHAAAANSRAQAVGNCHKARLPSHWSGAICSI